MLGHEEQSAEGALTLARQALEDSAMYVDHISNLLAQCSQHLQCGEDQEAMMSFARGTSDLEQFVQLVDAVVNLARPDDTAEISSFKGDLFDCVQNLEQAMVGQDFVALSDQIDGVLLPLLPRWRGVATELDQGLSAQGA